MKLKKSISSLLALTIFLSTYSGIIQVKAIDFEGNEDKYMNLCSSSNISRSNKSTCDQFNKYLKQKNKDLNSQLANQKQAASDTKATLESVQKELETINQQISDREAEINYLTTTINNLQANIEKNNQILRDRMYAMQSYTNENTYIDFIFGASSFSDMFSRIEGFNELTKNDQDLIKELSEQREQVKEQQKTLEDAKAVLVSQQNEQKALQTQYTALLEKQNKDIAYTQNAIYDYGEMTEELNAAIEEFNKNAYETPTPTPPPPVNNGGNNNSNNDNNNNDNNDNNDSSDENVPPSVGDLGERIYAAAYAKLGKLYWWGKSGPDYFDCSGLVYWSLKQAGVSGGRGTAASYSQKWSAVSFNNSQTGDLVCFGSPAYHIGIVIVNSDGSRSMIHAGGGDSSTHGNDPDAKVKISSIEPGSYYYSRISTIRRVS
ncbi:coiled-coil domain-containing protein [Thomasclavelia spiroformis]|jgi:peptidoglycan hydrolase CwlO-like protein|uniref:coiled-coil domain-containing protein n=1 Tax=Thomasclavelia spiroformis TaxID=29348 RepID=UPI00241CE691|nr:NlpC/P60 family protein [Thomasclavelia spiroformis]